MNEFITLSNQRRLREEEDIRTCYSFGDVIYRLLTLDFRGIVREPKLSFTATNESRIIKARGLDFIDLKEEIKRNWPNVARGLMERDRIGDSEKIIAYGERVKKNKIIEIYVNEKVLPPIVVYLSGLRKNTIRNDFVFYGDNKDILTIRNLIDGISRTYGYHQPNERTILRKIVGD